DQRRVASASTSERDMTTRVVDSTGGSKGGGRERAGVFALAGLIVTAIVVYLALNATNMNDKSRGMLPYQTLAATLPESDQAQFRALRESLLAAESARARTARWPDVGALTLPGGDYFWMRFERGVVVNYLGKSG